MKLRLVVSALGLLSGAAALPAAPVSLSAVVKPAQADFENAPPALNKTPRGEPLRIAGQTFADGVGTQVDNRLALRLGGATRFTALAGVDDATHPATPIHFALQADGTVLWQADLKAGDAPVPVDVNLAGHKTLVLVTQDIGNADTEALADWANARLDASGAQPTSAEPPAIQEPRVILTPPAAAAPQINGARVFGVRPGHPFLFTVAATGDRPMKFSAENLPDGLTLDAATGRITGQVDTAGSYDVTLHATNGHGTADGDLKIIVGDRIALTPAMGWNSWNCWGVSVDQSKVLASARAMVTSGLINHGWTYVNIDDTWQGTRRPTGDHPLQPNPKFPDLKQLSEQVHALGLKIGIYSTPWITSYAGHAGGSADNREGTWTPTPDRRDGWRLGRYSFAVSDANQWARWGIDYLKYDWYPNEPAETSAMADALHGCGRDIVYSLSNSAPLKNAAALSRLANSWRTTGDIHDSWGRLRWIWKQQAQWQPYGGPGHWNDPDMLVVGEVDVGRGRHLHPSRLTPNEQYTHISLWSLLSAPLLIGCPIERLDPFTLNLLTNDEVLAIDQDPLGAPAKQAIVNGRQQVYVKPMADGSHAVGLFNLAEEPQVITVRWSDLGLGKPSQVRDVWRQQNLPVADGKISASVPRHGVVLLRVWSGK